jgi:hypothetical protein
VPEPLIGKSAWQNKNIEMRRGSGTAKEAPPLIGEFSFTCGVGAPFVSQVHAKTLGTTAFICVLGERLRSLNSLRFPASRDFPCAQRRCREAELEKVAASMVRRAFTTVPFSIQCLRAPTDTHH